MSSVFPFAVFILPPAEDQIYLAREENMGYAERITRRTAFIDDVVVFVIFIAVRSRLQQDSPFLKTQYRTGTCR